VALGLDRDWGPLPHCPQPITLPVRHPDYPAWTGATDVGASWLRAADHVRYGPAAPWQADFPELHDQLAQLVAAGPAGPAMAGPAKASARRPGVPDVAAAGVPDPTLQSLHPLDLVLLGALHPPLAQMVGLYWADTTANPLGSYDYLVVADQDNLGGGDPKT